MAANLNVFKTFRKDSILSKSIFSQKFIERHVESDKKIKILMMGALKISFHKSIKIIVFKMTATEVT